MKTLEELKQEMEDAWADCGAAWDEAVWDAARAAADDAARAAVRAAARDAAWAAARDAEYVYRKRLKELDDEDA